MMAIDDLVGYCRALYRYDKSTGIVSKKYPTKLSVSRGWGEDMGSFDNSGYIKVWVNGAGYRAHTIVWVLEYGRLPVDMIDHIDGDRSNNIFTNLREVTRSQNAQNSRLKSAPKASGVRGVHHVPRNPKKPWAVSLRHGNKTLHLGYFATVDEAEQVWLKKCFETRGEYMPAELRERIK